MKQRCELPSDNRFARYGGRGIRVCERWHTFKNFLADMGEKPSPDHSIDRIDNDGNYEPGNCRWATRSEQANNRGDCRYLEWQGKRLTLTQWARELGMCPTTLARRLDGGWSVEKALTTPLDPTKVNRAGDRLYDRLLASLKAHRAEHQALLDAGMSKPPIFGLVKR